MSENRANIEIIAPTVEEAVAKGLSDLGLAVEAVDVEILDSGSKGLFGLGFRQARVRLIVKANPIVQAAPEASLTIDAAAVMPDQPEALDDLAQPSGRMPEGQEEQLAPQFVDQDEPALLISRQVLEELLERLKVKATVSASFGEPEDRHSKPPVYVDIQGDDLNILIGPRAEILNALQYIAGLIIGKELGHSIPLIVDVQGYRARRVNQVRQLARRMAEQAVKTGRRQVLEPMPANERRLVHIELRDNPFVTTESVGEEPRRKVTIAPK